MSSPLCAKPLRASSDHGALTPPPGRRVKALELEPLARPGSVSGPPTSWDYFADRAFRGLAQAGAWLILLLLAFILWSFGGKAWLAIRDHGVGFLTSTTWDVSRQQFGVLPQIWGTPHSSGSRNLVDFEKTEVRAILGIDL